jgi:hypothetical protein
VGVGGEGRAGYVQLGRLHRAHRDGQEARPQGPGRHVLSPMWRKRRRLRHVRIVPSFSFLFRSPIFDLTFLFYSVFVWGAWGTPTRSLRCTRGRCTPDELYAKSRFAFSCWVFSRFYLIWLAFCREAMGKLEYDQIIGTLEIS